MYQARQRTQTGDSPWRPPEQHSLINSYILHIAALVLWLHRIAQLSARGLPLPNGVRPLSVKLHAAVVLFAEACRTHFPAEWSLYVNAGPRDHAALQQRRNVLTSTIAKQDQLRLRSLLHDVAKELYFSTTNMCVMLYSWPLWVLDCLSLSCAGSASFSKLTVKIPRNRFNPFNHPLILFMLAACCTDKGGFVAQHAVGAHINPLLLLGRFTVMYELAAVGDAMGSLEEKEQSGAPLSEDERQQLASLRVKWKTLPSVLDARVGAEESTLVHPFSLVQTAGNYAMEINKYVHVLIKRRAGCGRNHRRL